MEPPFISPEGERQYRYLPSPGRGRGWGYV